MLLRAWIRNAVLGVACLTPHFARAQDVDEVQLEHILAYRGLVSRVEFEASRHVEAGSLQEAQHWENFLRQQSEQLLEEAWVQATIPSSTHQRAKELLKRILWADLGRILKSSFTKFRGFARTRGLGVVAGRLVGMAVQWSLIGAIGFGAAEVPKAAIGVIQVTPIKPFAMWAGHVLQRNLLRGQTVRLYGWAGKTVQRRFLRRKAHELYGGREELAQIEALRAEAAQTLGLAELNDIVLPMAGRDANFFAVVSKSTLFDRVKGWFGIADDRLTFETLTIELKNAQYWSPLFEELSRDASTIPRHVRALMLLQELSEGGNAEIWTTLRLRYPTRFQNVVLPDAPAPIIEWIQKLERARELPQVTQLLDRAPEGLSARQVVTLWREHLLPLYATQLEDVDFVSYRRLMRQQMRLDVLVDRAPPNAPWDKSWQRAFRDYLAEATDGQLHYPNRCLQSVMNLLRI